MLHYVDSLNFKILKSWWFSAFILAQGNWDLEETYLGISCRTIEARGTFSVTPRLSSLTWFNIANPPLLVFTNLDMLCYLVWENFSELRQSLGCGCNNNSRVLANFPIIITNKHNLFDKAPNKTHKTYSLLIINVYNLCQTSLR